MKRKNRINRRSLLNRYKKKCRQLLKHSSRRSGWYRYYSDVIKNAKNKGRKLEKNDYPKYKAFENFLFVKSKPQYSDNIQFLAENPNAFSKASIIFPSNGILKIPNPFSLTENFEESFLLLKKLFYMLYKENHSEIILDYEMCERIDVDASVCMDIMLAEFIKYYRQCHKQNFNCKIKSIHPINYNKEQILKILFSIGSFKNLKGFNIEYADIIPFPLIIGSNAKNGGKNRELEVTKMVDYIITCLDKMNRTLTWEAESDLSKVVGEVLINASEHSGRKYHYAIGYFQETKNDSDHLGVFNLTIFAFGSTIYETFKKLENNSIDVVKRMAELSERYTARHFFKPKEFEEETLWTLYALQEGVTSIPDKKRGNGSIHFIESFFRLKGDVEKDDTSCLTIVSGNTRIKFDGSYTIKEINKGKDNNRYKMMTFNTSGDIEEKPDPKYVCYAENFFPGTMISAKICIKFNNTEAGGDYE